MVRNYIRKGGHGGRRSNAGLPAGHWQDQGGRSAAAAAKAERIAKAPEEAAKKTAANHWQQWAKHSGEPQSASTQQQPAQQLADSADAGSDSMSNAVQSL